MLVGLLLLKEYTGWRYSTSPFMINYRVAGASALLKILKEEGCNVLDKFEDSKYGKFGWVIDPEGNKVELWEPPAGQ